MFDLELLIVNVLRLLNEYTLHTNIMVSLYGVLSSCYYSMYRRNLKNFLVQHKWEENSLVQTVKDSTSMMFNSNGGVVNR